MLRFGIMYVAFINYHFRSASVFAKIGRRLTNSSLGLRNIFMLTSNSLRTAISSLEQSGYYSFLSAHGLQTGYLIQIHPYL